MFFARLPRSKPPSEREIVRYDLLTADKQTEASERIELNLPSKDLAKVILGRTPTKEALWFAFGVFPVGLKKFPVFNLKHLSNLLRTTAPGIQLDLDLAEGWIRNSVGDTELADEICKLIELNRSVREMAELIDTRLSQSEEVLREEQCQTSSSSTPQ